MMTCPICGKKISDLDSKILENGNPACPQCVENEETKKEVDKEEKGNKERKEVK